MHMVGHWPPLGKEDRMLRRLPILLPTLVSFLVALSACLPWGAPMPVQFALPLITMAVIFYWAINQPRQLPSPVVFLIGLFTDLATAGPLGFWALNYLIGYAIGSYAPNWNHDRRDGPAAMLFFTIAVILVSLLGWLLTSLFNLQLTAVRPMLLGGLIAVAAYPVVTYVLKPIERAVAMAVEAGLFRQDDVA